MNVRSFLLFPFGADGTGFDTCYLPFFFLCFVKRCYNMAEFDTDCSKDFLKRLNRILCSDILKT